MFKRAIHYTLPFPSEAAASETPRRNISPALPKPAETDSLSRGRYVEALNEDKSMKECVSAHLRWEDEKKPFSTSY
jgi:hypothetical protein